MVAKKKRRVKRGTDPAARVAVRNLIRELLQEERLESKKILIAVVFPSGDKLYTYKIKYKHGLSVGDKLLAPGGGICKVVRTHALPVSNLKDEDYKEITQKVVPV